MTSPKYIIDDIDTTDSEISDKSDIESNDNIKSNDNIIIGIDLGTTNSCVSIWKNGNIEIIPDEYGNRTIPSIVSYSNITKYVGNEAKRQQKLNPKHTYHDVKRLIGRKIDEESVVNDIPYFSYDISSKEDKNILLNCNLSNRKKTYFPEEISAQILMKLKHMAELYLQTSITEAVITIPSYFNDSQRQATKDAATIAGLNCVRILHEPTAAALAYGLQNRSKFINKDMTILVYDLGGGTTDCSILNIDNGLFEVLASTGNTRLGGADFDKRLISYCADRFKKKK